MSNFRFINISREQLVNGDHKPSELIVTKIVFNNNILHSCEVKATICADKIQIHLPDICNQITDHSLRKQLEWSLMEYLEAKMDNEYRQT